MRQEIKQQAVQIPIDIRKAQDKALFKAFIKLDGVLRARTVMVFWGIDPEPETAGLISALLASGKQVALPRCLDNREMEARLYRGQRLVRNRLGIPEPGEDCPVIAKEEIDAVLVPALCYDRQGFRLGRGAGYYDRWLAGYEGLSVGMCYRELLQEQLPREDHDLPVRTLLTITV